MTDPNSQLKEQLIYSSDVLMDVERAIELSPQGSALIIVDMQAEGCERHGAEVKPVIRNIRALLDRFRQADGKIIHVPSVWAKDHPELIFFGKEYSIIEDSHAVEFVEELKPASDEIVVKKYSHNRFCYTTGITEAGSSALTLNDLNWPRTRSGGVNG